MFAKPSHQLMEKWRHVLDAPSQNPISDDYRRSITAILLENQLNDLREQRDFETGTQFLTEAPTNSAGTGGYTQAANDSGPVAGFDPVLISLVRRAMPNLVAYDLAGVQPMQAPASIVFALRSRYNGQQLTDPETFFDEVNTGFSGQNAGRTIADGDYVAGSDGEEVGFGTTAQVGDHPGLLNPIPGGTGIGGSTGYNVGQGMGTGDLENLGSGDATTYFNEMGFSIEKVTVTARGRALKAEYSVEMAQDIKAIHGLNAEQELANILYLKFLLKLTVRLFVPSMVLLSKVLKLT